MSEISELSEEELAFLEPFLPGGQSHNFRDDSAGKQSAEIRDRSLASRHDRLPFVTLTYACSLDGFISLAPGLRTTLSGPETKSMTHYLRLRHDAILVGVGTAVADDPSLNCRYPGIQGSDQPQPVVIDPSARWAVEQSGVLRLAEENKGKVPWIVHRAGAPASKTLSSYKVELLPVSNDSSESSRDDLDWLQILSVLKQKGIDSVMIEGGAKVVNSLLARPEIVDVVIVTLAPTWLGQGGVHVSPPSVTTEGKRENAARLSGTVWRQFGADAVLCGRI